MRIRWAIEEPSGIVNSHLPHVFDWVWQAPEANRRGAGLGLAIVEGVVKVHRGRIWVQSTPGHVQHVLLHHSEALRLLLLFLRSTSRGAVVPEELILSRSTSAHQGMTDNDFAEIATAIGKPEFQFSPEAKVAIEKSIDWAWGSEYEKRGRVSFDNVQTDLKRLARLATEMVAMLSPAGGDPKNRARAGELQHAVRVEQTTRR